MCMSAHRAARACMHQEDPDLCSKAGHNRACLRRRRPRLRIFLVAVAGRLLTADLAVSRALLCAGLQVIRWPLGHGVPCSATKERACAICSRLCSAVPPPRHQASAWLSAPVSVTS